MAALLCGSKVPFNGERPGRARVQWAEGIDSLAPARLTLMGLPIGKSIRTVPTVRIATALRVLEPSLWEEERKKSSEGRIPKGRHSLAGARCRSKQSNTLQRPKLALP